VARLIYAANTSLDGYLADERGDINWSAPSEEVFGFWTDFQRPIGTYVYGRGMYESMVYWENPSTGGDQPAAAPEFAEIWQAADKIVYSRTLQAPSSARTRIERDFDPAAIRRLKESSDRDITIGGADLAGQAMAAGLVDECHLVIAPVIIGGGKRALPDAVRVQLELLDERRFKNGAVHLRYGSRG
jgi:dihydrofolate reductase